MSDGARKLNSFLFLFELHEPTRRMFRSIAAAAAAAALNNNYLRTAHGHFVPQRIACCHTNRTSQGQSSVVAFR